MVGREDTLHFEGQDTLCVDRVEEQAGAGPAKKLSWKSPKPDALEVSVPMKEAEPGPVTLSIYQYGVAKPEAVAMTAYADAASLDRLTLSAGDPEALLRGTRLDEVAKAELEGVWLAPSTLSRVENHDQLTMKATGSTTGLEPGKQYSARVELKDGRLLKVPVTVEAPRPQAALLNKGIQEDGAAPASPVQLGSADDLPLEGRLVFFLKSTVPAKFPRNEKVEVAAADGSFATELSLADGGLMLEDAKTAIGTVEPLTRFGASAFGPLRVRVMSANGATGDWLPLGTLVRLPGFKELRCPRAATKPCMLTGINLFLATSIAATQDFENPIEVPQDFTGTQVMVPHPANGVLYLKLRDDPATVQTLTLPVTPATPADTRAAAAMVQPPTAPQSAAPAVPGTNEQVNPPDAPGATPAATPEASPPKL